MSVTYSQAIAQMVALINSNLSQAGAYMGQPNLNINFVEMGKEPIDPFIANQYYTRLTMIDARNPQTSFVSRTNAGDKRKFTAYGSAFVQVFTPIVITTSENDNRLLSEFIQNLLRQGTPDVKTQNVRVRVLDNDGNTYLRRNVIADYYYEQIA